MKITLGLCGATDCCLVLHNKNKSKQYSVESKAWLRLGEYWDIPKQSGNIPNDVGLEIWNNNDNDLIK